MTYLYVIILLFTLYGCVKFWQFFVSFFHSNGDPVKTPITAPAIAIIAKAENLQASAGAYIESSKPLEKNIQEGLDARQMLEKEIESHVKIIKEAWDISKPVKSLQTPGEAARWIDTQVEDHEK